jgi:hypothetical protein
VSFYCGYRCELESLPAGAEDGGEELGRPIIDVALLIPSGVTRRIHYETVTSDGWRVDAGQLVLDVHHLVQPTLWGSALRVVVPVPSGWSPAVTPEGAEVSAGEVIWEAQRSGQVNLTFTFVPDAAASGGSGER